MKAILIALTLAATPLHAGGPIIIEEPAVAEARPSSEGRWVLPVIVGLLVLGALASGGGSSDPVCNGPDDVPPTDGGC